MAQLKGKLTAFQVKDAKEKSGGSESKNLTPDRLREIHSLMVKSRVLEERLIKMSKGGEGYFWIGGPGEEAFAVPLGLMVDKGQGLDHDFLHLHYRGRGILRAMGAEPIDAIRQMKAVATDPYPGGRNFVNHYSKREWNVVPVASTIEPQYIQAIGTAHAQRGDRGEGITIVTGGDAGTAEGDFASCLVWASRPVSPLPILIIVTNNGYGISTSYEGQHGETRISDRAKAFNIEARTVNGNDVWEAWDALATAMNYVRTHRKPYFLELMVSRLYGHSSASGANRITAENDPITLFEQELAKRKILLGDAAKEVWEKWTQHMNDALKQVRTEPEPHSIFDHVYADENGDKGRDKLAESIGIDYPTQTAEVLAKKGQH